tara:strand:- start:41 stop:445 length:405 start_codon:yes stop_codon:yes gene_type:complete
LDHSEPLLQKYYGHLPQVILDRFKANDECISLKVSRIVSVPAAFRTTGVPRADVEALDNEYQSRYIRGAMNPQWAARQEKYDMMVDVLGLPSSECERSETFKKIMNSRKATLSRKMFIRRPEYRAKIVRELGRL